MSDDILDMFDIENQALEGESDPEQGDESPEEGTSEALEAAEETAEGESAPEAAAEPAEEPTEGAEEAEEPAAAPEEGEKLLAGKYKSVEDLEKAYTEDLGELQRLKNTEIDTLKQQMQQQQAQMEAFVAQQQQAQIANVSDEEIVKGLQVSPYETMGWLLETQPNRVAEGLSAIRELHGNEIADQMMLQIQSQQTQGVQEQVQSQYEALQQPAVVQGNIQKAMGALTEKYGAEFEELSEDTAQIVGEFEGIDFNNPSAIANALEVGFLHAWKAKATTAAETSTPTESSPQQFVETGTPGQEPQVSVEDEILNEVVEQFQQNQY